MPRRPGDFGKGDTEDDPVDSPSFFRPEIDDEVVVGYHQDAVATEGYLPTADQQGPDPFDGAPVPAPGVDDPDGDPDGAAVVDPGPEADDLDPDGA